MDARYLDEAGEAGAAVALLGEVTPADLRDAVGPLLADPGRHAALAERARDAGRPDAADRLVDVLLSVADGPVERAEAGDPQLRTTALRSLAIQAIEFGHGREVIDIARHPVSGIRRGCPVRTRAWITGAHVEATAIWPRQ